MESKVQSLSFFRFAVHLLAAFVLLAMLAAPLSAGNVTITIKSDVSNVGVSVAAGDSRLSSGDTSGLSFTSSVGTDNEGSYTGVPGGAPPGTIVVQVPPECGSGCGQSGFVEKTFTLPTGYSAPTLSGAANVDDSGYAFLNGNLISPQLTEYGNVAFTTSNATFFQPGVNTFVISDNNSGGGPSAVVYYAAVTYTAVPEPSLLLMLGAGLAGVVGIVGAARRKLI